MSKRTRRTDIHRPGAIVPTAYTYRMSYALPDPTWPGDKGYNLDPVRAFCEGIGWGRDRPMFGHLGKCGICGAVYRMGDLWEHENGDVIHVGHECAAKYEMLCDYAEFDAAMNARKQAKANVLEHARRLEVRAAFLSQHPDLEQALATDHNISRDLSDKLTRWGSLSEKQIALAFRLQEQVKNPPPPKPEPPKGTHKGTVGKRETFALSLVAVRSFDRAFEETGYVFIFQDPDGSDLVWFTSAPPCNKPTDRDHGSGRVFGGPIPVRVKATVKGHGERQGRPQTMLTRAAITWPDGCPQSWDELRAGERLLAEERHQAYLTEQAAKREAQDKETADLARLLQEKGASAEDIAVVMAARQTRDPSDPFAQFG